jgi:hypothetical protein
MALVGGYIMTRCSLVARCEPFEGTYSLSSRYLLACRWRQYVPSKCSYTLCKLHGVVTKNYCDIRRYDSFSCYVINICLTVASDDIVDTTPETLCMLNAPQTCGSISVDK